MVLGTIGVVFIVLAVLVGRYLYNNLHYDEVLMSRVRQSGIVNKQVTLPDDSVINYGEGPSNGPALLLIHGQTVAWEDYDKVLPELTKSFHVYAIDCYGHGKSSHDADLYSCKANGEALTWFMSHVIKDNCYVSGHSSGGILAAWIAAHAPKQIDGLLLEDPPLFRVTPEEIQEGKGAFAWYDGYIVANRFMSQTIEEDYALYYLKNSYLLTLFGGLGDRVIQAAVKYRHKNPDRPIQIAWVPHTWLRALLYMDNYDPEFGNAFYNGSWMKDVEQETMLQRIQCPVIYLKANTLYGKDGVLYAANTDDDANRVQDLMDGCERINIKSGHNIHLEHPDVFIAACKALLNDRRGDCA